MSGYDGRGGKFDIIIPRGSDIAFTVTATDSLSAAIDLSAATIAGELYTATGAVADTMTAAVSGAGSNIITLSFTDAETALLTDASYPWCLWVTRGGDKRPWLAGRVRVVDSSNGVRSTDGDAVTLTVDSDVNVSIDVLAVGGAGGASTTVSDTAPVSPSEGDMWFNSSNATLYVYYDSSWIVATVSGVAEGTYQPLDADLTALAAAGNSAVLAATTASFLTADESKLDGIAAGATDDTTVNNHIADTSDAHDASAISIADVATQYTATDVEAALAEVKVIADAAVTPAEAAAAYQPLAAVLTATTASFTTADETKLDGIEAGADVTDATNVAAAGGVMNTGNETIAGVKTFSSSPLVPGPTTEFQAATKGYVDQTALLDSEVDADIKTLSLPANTTISTFGASLIDDADAAAALVTLGAASSDIVMPTIMLTAAEYAALSPPEADTIYYVVG